MTFIQWGAASFGFLLGWITYRTLRRKEGGAALSDIATVTGAVGGGIVTALFKSPEMFAAYSMGLLAGFILYLVVAFFIGGKAEANGFMGD